MKNIRFVATFMLIGLSITLVVGVMSFLTAMTLQGTGHDLDSSLRVVLCFGPPILVLALMPLAGAMLFVLRRVRSTKDSPDETELVQTLARRANEMSHRLEAVETILLEQNERSRETTSCS